ncbi:MAG: hypothetical protein WC294_04910 [Methanoregula sp.]|jgi:hypothetical protein
MRLTLDKIKRVEVPGDEDGGFVNIKVLSLEDLAAIEAKSSDMAFTENGGVTVSINSYNRANLVARKCLTGWGNFFNEKGEELKFPKDIGRAARYSITINGKEIRFLEWVEQCHTQHREEIKEEMAVASKN